MNLATLPAIARLIVWAEMIQVRWQSIDTVVLNLQSQQTSDVAVVTSTWTSSTADLGPFDDKQLSIGAKAGIGIGAAALVILLTFGALLLSKKRESSGTQQLGIASILPQYEDSSNSVKEGSEEIDGHHYVTNCTPQTYQRAELAS